MTTPKRLLVAALGVGTLLTLTVPAAAQRPCSTSCETDSCTFRGIPNSPLGDAVLAIDGDCQLVVDGIGGSGFDGVVQRELRSVYMKTTLGTPNFSLSATGTQAIIRQLGVVDDRPDVEVMLTRIINFDDHNIRHSISCSTIFVEGYRIWLFNGTELVHHQEHGVSPPLLVYPKTDIQWMACGIWPDGDVYSVFQLGAPQSITMLESPVDPGPYVADLVFVEAFSPQLVPSQQTAIENTFFATGPVTLASIEAGSNPGDGPPCLEATDRRRIGSFVAAGWSALDACSRRGEPACPAPCNGFPNLEDSELSPACYESASRALDRLTSLALADSWGPYRCPLGAASPCDQARANVVGRMLSTGVSSGQKCRTWLDQVSNGLCNDGFCSEAAAWVSALHAPRQASLR